MSDKRQNFENLMAFIVDKPGVGTRTASPPAVPPEGQHFEELAASFRARKPLPADKRSGPSLIDGLPDPHDLFGL